MEREEPSEQPCREGETSGVAHFNGFLVAKIQAFGMLSGSIVNMELFTLTVIITGAGTGTVISDV